jgi:glycosyltransferase involved in cell wall biosynthesis
VDIRDLWPDFIIERSPVYLRFLATIFLFGMEARNRKVLTVASGITALTDFFLAWGLSRRRRLLSEDKARVFPMGYLPKTQSGVSEYAAGQVVKAGIKLSEFNIVFFGTFGRGFDFVKVIDAARLLENSLGGRVSFILCGDGDGFDRVKRLADGVSNIQFPGWVGRGVIAELLDSGDVGLLPYIDSKNFRYNLPNKPAEYLAGGLSLACSLGGGSMADLIQSEGCGFVYSSAEDLAFNIERLFRLRNLQSEMSENSRSAFSKYLDGSKIYRNYVDFLQSIAEK